MSGSHADVNPSFLVLSIDIEAPVVDIPTSNSSLSIKNSSTTLDVNDFIRQIVTFSNAYCLMHRRNRLVILGNHLDKVHVIFPDLETQDSTQDKFIPILHKLPSIIVTNILKILNHASNESKVAKSTIVNALSIALCVINKQMQLHPNMEPRILVIQSKKCSHGYNAFMNVIFSAQKLRAIVDAVVLMKEASNFFQQACFLTNGIYQHIKDQSLLLPLLFSHYLSAPTTRAYIKTPLQQSIDFKASCSCHQQSVEFAYMCSVCLTLSCDELNQCPTCNTPSRKIAKLD